MWRRIPSDNLASISPANFAVKRNLRMTHVKSPSFTPHSFILAILCYSLSAQLRTHRTQRPPHSPQPAHQRHIALNAVTNAIQCILFRDTRKCSRHVRSASHHLQHRQNCRLALICIALARCHVTTAITSAITSSAGLSVPGQPHQAFDQTRHSSARSTHPPRSRRANGA